MLPAAKPYSLDVGITRRRALPLLTALSATLVAQPAPAGTSYTVGDRVSEFGPVVRRRLKSSFTRAGVAFPPAEVALLVFKDRRAVQVYARSSVELRWRHIVSYPVLAASGKPGPKLTEGDQQVPEGIYRAEALNPNSRFHLSIRVNYPNTFDRRMAAADGRTRLGGDIMVHGNAVSIGCLAMGDQVAEDLFILAALTGKDNVSIIISPTDFRRRGATASVRHGPSWLPVLHVDLQRALAAFPRPA